MTPYRIFITYTLTLALLAAACSENSSPRPDGSAPADSGVQDGTSGPKLVWTKVTLDTSWGSGVDTSLAVRGSSVGIAYYRQLQDTVVTYCPPAGLTPGSDRPRPAYDLYYISHDGNDWGEPVKVDRRIGEDSFGLSLLFSGSNQINIGYMGGEVGVTNCASSDALIATSQDGRSWSIETRATTGPFAGDSVGAWMSLAADSAGQVHAVHKDIRFGYYEHDGQFKASTLYDGGEVISAEDGSGTFNNLLIDSEDRPLVVFYREVGEQGLVLGQRHGSTWQLSTLRRGATAARPSLGTDGEGNFGLAFYNPLKQMLGFLESSGDLSQWEEAIVDRNLSNNGKYSAVAYDSQGNPAVSYYTCGPYSGQGQDSCDFGKDGLMFAHRLAGKWKIYEVDSGSFNKCGTFTSLGFLPGDEPIISYQCVGMDVDNDFVDNLKVAHGRYQ